MSFCKSPQSKLGIFIIAIFDVFTALLWLVWKARVPKTDELLIQFTKLPIFWDSARTWSVLQHYAGEGNLFRLLFYPPPRHVLVVGCSHESDDLKMANITPQDAEIAQYL